MKASLAVFVEILEHADLVWLYSVLSSRNLGTGAKLALVYLLARLCIDETNI